MQTKETFREIFETHKKLVFNLALSYVQNIEDAEEITQDVFFKVHQNLNKFEQKSEVKTWIYRITINTSLDFLKAKKTKKRFAFFTSLFHTESNEPIFEVSNFNHPGVELENKEATENIFRLINQLPERQKTALILSKIEGKPQSEIAEVMNLSIKAVESLLQRAKNSLSEKLNIQNKGNKK